MFSILVLVVVPTGTGNAPDGLLCCSCFSPADEEQLITFAVSASNDMPALRSTVCLDSGVRKDNLDAYGLGGGNGGGRFKRGQSASASIAVAVHQPRFPLLLAGTGLPVIGRGTSPEIPPQPPMGADVAFPTATVVLRFVVPSLRACGNPCGFRGFLWGPFVSFLYDTCGFGRISKHRLRLPLTNMEWEYMLHLPLKS